MSPLLIVKNVFCRYYLNYSKEKSPLPTDKMLDRDSSDIEMMLEAVIFIYYVVITSFTFLYALIFVVEILKKAKHFF